MDGARLAGSRRIDRIWRGLVHYHGVIRFDPRGAPARYSIVRALVDNYDALEHRAAA